MRFTEPSAIAVTPITSDRHGSTTNSRTHVPRLCGIYYYDIWRDLSSPQNLKPRTCLTGPFLMLIITLEILL